MGYDNRVIIERATNGYTVQMRDPKIVAANRKRDLSSERNPAPWQDPEKTYVFATMAALTTFLTANLDKALPQDDYETSFDVMSGEQEEDDD